MRSSTLGPKIWLPSLEPWGDVRVFGFFAALMLGFIETSSDGTAAFEFKGADFPAPRSRCRILQLLLKGILTKRIDGLSAGGLFVRSRFGYEIARILRDKTPVMISVRD